MVGMWTHAISGGPPGEPTCSISNANGVPSRAKTRRSEAAGCIAVRSAPTASSEAERQRRQCERARDTRAGGAATAAGTAAGVSTAAAGLVLAGGRAAIAVDPIAVVAGLAGIEVAVAALGIRRGALVHDA